jgi:hypothetical protein
MRMLHVVMTILLVSAFPIAVPAQVPPPSQINDVTGIVIDRRTERPLAGVRVSVDSLSQSVETDSEGRFRLGLPAGRHTLTVSLVGYAMARPAVDVADIATPPLTIRLSEGAGVYEEQVTVSGDTPSESALAPAASALHAGDLQALRGVTLDDPLRAVHALPSVTATDDFYSEFAVRGSAFRHVGLVVDGVPTQYLMHAVHGVTDGGSIAMINTDALGNIVLMPGSYPQRIGRHLTGELDLTMREGDRREFRARAGLSGTSATVLAEGPLHGNRGSWLVSARRSYLDLLLERIDDQGNFGFGFTDAQAKIVLDLGTRHQLQVLALGGASAFDEEPDDLRLNDLADSKGRSWLTSLAWRFTPSSRVALTQRIYATGLSYQNKNRESSVLDANLSADVGWRADAIVSATRGVVLEIGADAQRLTERYDRWRSVNDAPTLSPIASYNQSGTSSSVYAQAVLGSRARLVVAPGVRMDYWGLSRSSATSPWITTEFALASATRVRAGAGIYRQFPALDQIFGVRGGGDTLVPETARHIDVGLTQALRRNVSLQVTWFARAERDLLWTPGAEPRRLADGSIQRGRADAPWTNTLDGEARGVEVVIRSDAPNRFSGWAGYAYGRHRLTNAVTGETFWADQDQRHTLSLFGHYRLSNRTSIGAKYRYGSNYPLLGYIGEQPAAPGAPALFGGEQPLFYGLSETRNGLRLPAYSRLDVRMDRTFMIGDRRLTLFGEVANVLNRRNLRNVPYGVGPTGLVFGPTDSLMPIVPSAGIVIEF